MIHLFIIALLVLFNSAAVADQDAPKLFNTESICESAITVTEWHIEVFKGSGPVSRYNTTIDTGDARRVRLAVGSNGSQEHDWVVSLSCNNDPSETVLNVVSASGKTVIEAVSLKFQSTWRSSLVSQGILPWGGSSTSCPYHLTVFPSRTTFQLLLHCNDRDGAEVEWVAVYGQHTEAISKLGTMTSLWHRHKTQVVLLVVGIGITQFVKWKARKDRSAARASGRKKQQDFIKSKIGKLSEDVPKPVKQE